MSLLRPLFAAILTSALCAVSFGQLKYAQTSQNIKAAVVILDSAKRGQNNELYGRSAAPFAFYNLDSAVGIKPAGWNIYNPHAPGVVTPDMVPRWQEITGGADVPVVNAPISKRNAEYWALYLSQATDQVLSDYDVLLLNPYSYAQLNAGEIAKLLKFVARVACSGSTPPAAKRMRTEAWTPKTAIRSRFRRQIPTGSPISTRSTRC